MNTPIKKKLFAGVFLAALFLNFAPAAYVPVMGAPKAEALTWLDFNPLYAGAKIGNWISKSISGIDIGAYMKDKMMKIGMAIIEFLVGMLFSAAGLFMLATGAIMDFALEKTMDSALFNSLQIINVGWTISRDVANMFFIFILLYIAIQTILGLMSHQTKTLLRNIIIVAILINFSLFFTKVIIDTTNILALAFYYKVQTVTPSGTLYGPSNAIYEGLKIQSLYGGPNTSAPATGNGLEIEQRIMVKLGGSVLMFIVGYIFLVGAIMMVIRSVALILCMMFSPLAFLGMVLPKMGGVTSAWWKHLLDNALVAPVFCFLIYIDVQFIRLTDLAKMSGSTTDNWNDALKGDPQNWKIIYNFVILIIVFLATLSISRSVSSGTSAWTQKAMGWGKTGAGYGGAAAIGSVAFLGRRFGQAADAAKDSAWMQRMAAKGGMAGIAGRSMVSMANVAAKSSFDLRAAPGMGVLQKTTGVGFGAAGGKGGARAARREKYDEVVKKAKELFPNNPDAQDRYIQAHTVTAGSVTKAVVDRMQGKDTAFSAYNQKPSIYAEKADKTLSDTKKEIEKEKDENAKKSDAKELMDMIQKNGVNATFSDEDVKKLKLDPSAIGTSVAKALGEKFDTLSGKSAVEMLSKEQRGDEKVLGQFNKQMVAYMTQNPEQYQDTLRNLTQPVMKTGREDTRAYLLQQAKFQNPNIKIDLNGEMKNAVTEYDQAETAYNASAKSIEDNKRWVDFKRANQSKVQAILGTIKPEDINGLDDNTKSHKAVVMNYQEKHFQEIETYHNNIRGLKDEDKVILADIRQKATGDGGSSKSRNAMGKLMKNSKSAYYDASKDTGKKSVTDAEQKLAEARKSLEEKRAEYNNTPEFQSGKRSDIDKKIKEAEKAEKELDEKIKRMRSERTNDGATDSSEDEDADEDMPPPHNT